jgi:hypothetical protein
MKPDKEQWQKINEHLDGLPDDGSRSSLESKMAEDSEFRKEVELQNRVAQSLRSEYQAPDAQRAWRNVQAAAEKVVPKKKVDWRRSPWVAVAAMLILSLAMWRVWVVVDPLGHNKRKPRVYTFAQAYEQIKEDGYKPTWECKTEEEFVSFFHLNLRENAAVRGLPPNMQALGLSNLNVFSERSLVLLGRVDGKDVLVFIDRLENDKPQETPAGLHSHRRVDGSLVFYEFSVLDKPVLMQYLVRLGSPESPPN